MNKNKQIKKIKAYIKLINDDVKLIKQKLIDARITDFIMVRDYDPSATITYQDIKEPISLENMQNEINRIKRDLLGLV